MLVSKTKLPPGGMKPPGPNTNGGKGNETFGFESNNGVPSAVTFSEVTVCGPSRAFQTIVSPALMIITEGLKPIYIDSPPGCGRSPPTKTVCVVGEFCANALDGQSKCDY